MAASSLCCCSPCRPTYRRHVDAIYPANPEEGLVKGKMETLLYYSVTSPEKLDRIGEYLEQRIARDLYRGRRGYVMVGVEAFDQLIKSCHINTLNLFVESYLKSVGKLIESPDPDFQIMASQSFLAFSHIKEDTPSYHRSYNFFIERFSQMCHSETADRELTRRIRLSGLHGLNGVIRKTVNEDLAENIWDAKHMDKIVPSLLYNIDPSAMSTAAKDDRETPDLHLALEDMSPSRVADQILRELVMAATFTSLKTLLRPMLQFMRDHSVWDEPGLARAMHIFEAVMYSIQVDLSYLVIDKLIASLDTPKLSVMQKASIAIVLSKIIGIGVGDSTVGPAVLEIINDLLKHLRKTLEKEKVYDQSTSAPLQQLQYALLESLGEYASKMPDFQKIEIMTFILSKIPVELPQAADHELQFILMKALNCVAEKHTPTLFSTTFSPQLLSTLLRLLQATDQDVRLLVLQTFQILVDRHSNREKLVKPVLRPENLDLESYPNRFNRSDQMFVQKNLFNIFTHFKRALEEQGSNSVDFIEAVYATCALLYVETSGTDESAVCLLDLVDSVQGVAVSNMNLSTENRFALHAIAICFLALLASSIGSAELDAYLDDLVESRQAKSSHLLPPLREQYHPGLNPNTPEEDVLIDVAQVKEALRNAGRDVQRMDMLVSKRKSPSRSSWPDPPLPLSAASSRRTSMDGGLSVSGLEEDGTSLCSSPGITRKPFPEEISAAAFKKVLEGPSQEQRQADEQARKELGLLFARASLDELVKATTSSKDHDIREYLDDLFQRLSYGENGNGAAEIEMDALKENKAPYESIFPELFMY